MKSRDVLFFEKGYKPGLILGKTHESVTELLEKYPYVEAYENFTYNSYIFFLNEDLKNSYLEQMPTKGAKKTKQLHEQRLIGKYCGYPPVAYENFGKHEGSVPFYFLDYHGGIVFSVFPEHLKDALNFLEEQVPIAIQDQTVITITPIDMPDNREIITIDRVNNKNYRKTR